MKEIIQGFYQKKHFWTRLILVIAAVILMGFALSWLLLVDLGTDPCTLLNQTISTRLGISIGNWQALFNTVLLIFVIIFGGRNLGSEPSQTCFSWDIPSTFSPGSGRKSFRQTSSPRWVCESPC